MWQFLLAFSFINMLIKKSRLSFPTGGIPSSFAFLMLSIGCYEVTFHLVFHYFWHLNQQFEGCHGWNKYRLRKGLKKTERLIEWSDMNDFCCLDLKCLSSALLFFAWFVQFLLMGYSIFIKYVWFYVWLFFLSLIIGLALKAVAFS